MLCVGTIQPRERLILLAPPCVDFGDLIGLIPSLSPDDFIQRLLRLLRVIQRILNQGNREQLPCSIMDLPCLGERLIQSTIVHLDPSEVHVRERKVRIDFQTMSKRRSCFR